MKFLGFYQWLPATSDWQRDENGEIVLGNGYVEGQQARWSFGNFLMPVYEASSPVVPPASTRADGGSE